LAAKFSFKNMFFFLTDPVCFFTSCCFAYAANDSTKPRPRCFTIDGFINETDLNTAQIDSNSYLNGGSDPIALLITWIWTSVNPMRNAYLCWGSHVAVRYDELVHSTDIQ
jgi:hypothetical protein